MHTRQSSTPSSEFSLVSSLDNLTLSASQDSISSSPVIVDDRHSPAASTSLSPNKLSSSISDAFDSTRSDSPHLSSRRPSGSSTGAGRTDSEYEVILVPSPVQRKHTPTDSSSRAATPTKPKGKGKTVPGTKIEPDATPKKAVKGKASIEGTFRVPLGAPVGKGKAPIVVKEEPPTSASSASTSTGEDLPHRKTRRGGRRNRARAERAQVRDILKADPDSTPTTSPLLGPDRDLSGSSSLPELGLVESYRDLYEEDSEDGASRFLDEGELDDESEVDGMSVLQGTSGKVGDTPGRRVIVKGSVMSSEDAKCSIDSFLAGDPDFMGDKANKLRLWQALCIELGLVEVPSDLPDLPVVPPPQSTIPEPTFDLLTFPLPSSLAQARKMLKENAHINLADYLDARSSGGQQYRHLLYPSERAMKKYTSKEKKFVPLPSVKEEWLEPLLKDFGFKRSRKVSEV